MKIISFIEAGQENVIEKILKLSGLWEQPDPRGPPEYTTDSAVPDHKPAPLNSKWNWTTISLTNSAWSSLSSSSWDADEDLMRLELDQVHGSTVILQGLK